MQSLRNRRVLVLDGELRSALAVVRSLGRQGVTIVVGAATSSCLAGASKYATVEVSYANPEFAEEQFINDIEAHCRQYAITDLLPLSEIALGSILRYRSRFAALSLPYVDRETYELAVDKYALGQIGETLGIRSPKTFLCDSSAAAAQHINSLHYPVVLKPVRSRVYSEGTWLLTKVQYAFNIDELHELIRHNPQYQHPFMLQEFIDGDGKGVFFLYNRGTEVARFSHRRIREKPPSGGVSVLSESERADDHLFEQAAKLLTRLAWHGVAMVEFKVSRTGEPFLMEINPRFWGSLQLAIDAGVDFPALLLAMSTEEVAPVSEFREGVRLRWLLGDFDHLVIIMKSKAYSLPRKLKTLLSFCNFFTPGTRYETLRLDDARPFFRELKLYVASFLAPRSPKN